MFISLAYLFIYWYQCFKERNKMARYMKLIKESARVSSFMIRRMGIGSGEGEKMGGLLSVLVEQPTTVTSESNQIEVNNRFMCSIMPQLKVNLHNWTSYLDSQNYPTLPVTPDPEKCYILMVAQTPEDEEEFLAQSFSVPDTKRVKIMDYTTPIAWKAGQPFGIVAECTYSNLSHLTLAFVEGAVMMDDLLQLQSMSTVSLEGHAINLLRVDSSQEPLFSPSSPRGLTPSNTPVESRAISPRNWEPVFENLQQAGIAEEETYRGSNESLAYASSADLVEDDSPNKAKATNMNLRETTTFAEYGDSEGMAEFEMSGGEAPSGSLAELAPEVLTPAHRKHARGSGKPPNVLIYCGKKDSNRQFEAVCSVIQQCLNPDKYVIYHLKHEQVLTAPWKENTSLLIIASDKVYDGVDEAFLKFFLNGGLVLSFGSMFDRLIVERTAVNRSLGIMSLDYNSWKGVNVICGRHVYEGADTSLEGVTIETLAIDNGTKKPVLLEAVHGPSMGISLLSQVHLDKDPVEMGISADMFSLLKQANPARFALLREWLERLGMDCSPTAPLPLTACALLATHQSKKSRLLDSIQQRLQGGKLRSGEVTLHFVQTLKDVETEDSEVSCDSLPVVTSPGPGDYHFNFEEYEHNLKTEVLGQVIMYADVVTSTMTMFEGWMLSLPADVGVVAIARHQVKGKGRGENAWLSPAGCAMFSLHVRVRLPTRLGQRVAYLQHITSLAVVEAVRSRQGCQSLDMRLKWPNDIYFGSKLKLGGVIVKSSIMQDIIHCNVGCGFNVTNKDPTTCINDAVEQHNTLHGTTLPPFTTEELIAATISNIEQLVGLFQSEGKEAFLEKYYSRWLHSDAEVTIEKEDGTREEVKVIGLDDYGYLAVQSPDGSTQSVHPDGNSFDMMRNLILPKTR